MTQRALAWMLIAALCGAGCSKDEEGKDEAPASEGEGEAAKQQAEPEPKTPEEKWEAEVEEIEEQLAEAAKDRKLRVVKTKTLGEGEDKAYEFELENTTDRKITWGQSWVYYYDAEDDCIDRYPHSFVQDIGPGETVKMELGQTKERLEDGTASAEVEITAVKYEDDSEWANENLVQPRFDREKGGLSDDVLAKREGEKVVGQWTGERGEEGKPTFRLTNLTDAKVEPQTIWIYYYDEKGESLGRDVANVRGTEIAAGETIAWEGGATEEELEEGTVHIEPSVAKVKIDGEEWENRNLADTDRPPRSMPEA